MKTDNDLFIERMINVIRGHACAERAGQMEPSATTGELWQRTTPQQYLTEVVKIYGIRSEAIIRDAADRALNDGQLGGALFLIIVLSRLPEYLEQQKRQRPWDFE